MKRCLIWLGLLLLSSAFMASAQNNVLAQLNARGTTMTASTNTVNGTNVYYRYLMLLGVDGRFDAGFMPATSNSVQVVMNNVRFVDAVNGGDNTNVYNGTILRPYKTLTNAVNLNLTSNMTYVLAPGIYASPSITNVAVTNMTLLGWDPDQTSLSGQFRIDNDRAFTLNAYRLKLNEVKQMQYRNLSVGLYDRVAVLDQVHRQYPTSINSWLTLTRDPSVTLAYPISVTNSTEVLACNATNVGYTARAAVTSTWLNVHGMVPIRVDQALDLLAGAAAPTGTVAGQMLYWTSSSNWALVTSGTTNQILYGGAHPAFGNYMVTFGTNNIPADFVPATNNVYSLGTDLLRWNTGWFGTAVVISNVTLTVTNGVLYANGKRVVTNEVADSLSASLTNDWTTAYTWGNHATNGYLTSATDDVARAWATYGSNTAYAVSNSWFQSAAFGIAAADSNNWTTAYGWGNHATNGYLTFETDPISLHTNDSVTVYGSNGIFKAGYGNGAAGLSSALAAAIGGDTLHVRSGWYTNIVTLATNINIVGDGKDATFIKGLRPANDCNFYNLSLGNELMYVSRLMLAGSYTNVSFVDCRLYGLDEVLDSGGPITMRFYGCDLETKLNTIYLGSGRLDFYNCNIIASSSNYPGSPSANIAIQLGGTATMNMFGGRIQANGPMGNTGLYANNGSVFNLFGVDMTMVAGTPMDIQAGGKVVENGCYYDPTVNSVVGTLNHGRLMVLAGNQVASISQTSSGMVVNVMSPTDDVARATAAYGSNTAYAVSNSWFGSIAFQITSFDTSAWYQAYNWLMSNSASLVDTNYLTNALYIAMTPVRNSSNNWNTAFSWGNHGMSGYFKADGSVLPTAPWNMNGQAATNYGNVSVTGMVSLAASQRIIWGDYASTYIEGSSAVGDPCLKFGVGAASIMELRPAANGIDVKSHRIINLSDGINPPDAVTMSQLSVVQTNAIDQYARAVGNYGSNTAYVTSNSWFQSPVFGVTAANSNNWTTAFNWGNHGTNGYFKANGSVLPTANWNLDGYSVTNTGHVIPKSSNTYDLGSAKLPYRDLYLDTNSIYMGGQKALSYDTVTTQLVANIPVVQKGTGTNNISYVTNPVASRITVTDTSNYQSAYGYMNGNSNRLSASGISNSVAGWSQFPATSSMSLSTGANLTASAPVTTVAFTSETNGLTSGNFMGIGCSKDGSKLIVSSATIGKGGYVSVNGGTNWTYADSFDNSYGADCSSDGTVMYYGCAVNGLEYSVNSGTTWGNRNPGMMNVNCVACNDDGTIVIVSGGSPGMSGANPIKLSYDTGATWASKGNAGSTHRAPCMSDNGQIMYITEDSTILRSTDRGTNWASCVGMGANAMDCTPDGRTVVAVSDYIYVSTDTGSNWTQRGSSMTYYGITVSTNGQYMVAAAGASVGSTQIYCSNDGGVTWSGPFGSAAACYDMAMPANGLLAWEAGATGPNQNLRKMTFAYGMTAPSTLSGFTIYCSTNFIYSANASNYVCLSSDLGNYYLTRCSNGVINVKTNSLLP